MYKVIEKFLAKTTVTVVTIVSLAGGMIPQYVNAESNQIYVQSTKNEKTGQQRDIGYSFSFTSDESINKRLKSLLGTLDNKVSEKEREKAYNILKNIMQMEAKRKEEKIYKPSESENSYVKQLNKYLNELTIKYYKEAKRLAQKLEDAYIQQPSIKNPIIENIKSFVSAKDYKKIKKLYEDYVKDKLDLAEAADDIYTILLKYKSLKADDVLINIFTADNGTVAKFTINTSNMSLTYQDPTGTGIKKLSNKKVAEYKKAWKELRKIIPDALLKDFKEFDISTDGKYGVLAFVQNLDDVGKTWRISIDPADMEDKIQFANTVIHEYGHYLSLNEKQVTYINEKTDASIMDDFDLYKESLIVSKKDSYINKFYNEYWNSFAIDRDINTSNQLFYFRHSDEFINTYASTSCAEDFAECFSAYVLPYNFDLFKKQQVKIDFFEQFGEIRAIKKQILSNMRKNGIIK